MNGGGWREPAHGANQSLAQLGAEPAAFPVTTAAAPLESAFPDWRERLERNFSRACDGRWEPLTRVHATEGVADEQLHRGLMRLCELA